MALTHICHPYEDRSLTFKSLKDIIKKIINGDIKELHEKTDGINLYLTWDFKAEEIRVARNKENISYGGMDRAALDEKYKEKEILHDVFLSAYDCLSQAFKSLSYHTLASIFGATGGVWFSLEIIHPEAKNLIQYNKKAIVFHKLGTTMFDWDNNPMFIKTERHFRTLELVIKHLNEAVEESGWIISGPLVVKPNEIPEDYLNKLFMSFDNCVKIVGATYGITIQDYTIGRLKREMAEFSYLPADVKTNFIKRIQGNSEAKTIQQISKGLSPLVKEQIRAVNKKIPSVIASFVFPIEKVLYDFGCAALQNCKAEFVEDNEKEIKRLQGELQRCIEMLQNTNDERAQGILKKHMPKLKSSNNFNTSVEGIVFLFRNKPYKITGSFAPANQICGYVKYKMTTEIPEDNYSLRNYLNVFVAG